MAPFRLVLVLCSVLVALSSGCTREPATPKNSARTEKPTIQEPVQEKIHIALGGMITPKEGVAYYRDLLRFLGQKVGRSVEIIDADGYAEINRKLENGELDAAFVCSGPYVMGKRRFGLQLIAAPQAYGKTEYYSHFIVPKDSPARTVSDLRGKTFAFTDPLSNSGKLVPEYVLSLMQETPRHFFGKTLYSGSHDESIKAVAKGLVDGAAVDSLIWEYINRKHPDRTAGTRILYKSPPYAPPPFVVRPGLSPELKSGLRTALLDAHTTPQGKAILDQMLIDRFTPVEDTAYDSVRELLSWLSKRGGSTDR